MFLLGAAALYWALWLCRNDIVSKEKSLVVLCMLFFRETLVAAGLRRLVRFMNGGLGSRLIAASSVSV